MPWKLVPSEDPEDLSDRELIGLSVLAAQGGQEMGGAPDVYLRAWEKIQPAVQQALQAEEETPEPTRLTPDPVRVEGGL